MTKEEAIKKAHEMYAYEESERSDEETGDFDALWQSIYDACQLGSYGILDFMDDEIEEAREWLKETQSMTKKYKETEIYF